MIRRILNVGRKKKQTTEQSKEIKEEYIIYLAVSKYEPGKERNTNRSISIYPDNPALVPFGFTKEDIKNKELATLIITGLKQTEAQGFLSFVNSQYNSEKKKTGKPS